MATTRKPTPRKPRPLTLDERVAVLEAELVALTDAHVDLAGLLREHMAREEETTQAVMRSLSAIEQRMSRWHGVAIGGGLVVSALWSVAVAAVAWMR